MAVVAWGFFSLTQTTVGSISRITIAALITAISSDVTSGDADRLVVDDLAVVRESVAAVVLLQAVLEGGDERDEEEDRGEHEDHDSPDPRTAASPLYVTGGGGLPSDLAHELAWPSGPMPDAVIAATSGHGAARASSRP